jgi:hypothetical protein
MLVPRVIRGFGVTLLACVLAVVLTYPLAFKMDRAGRLGSGDGQFSLWCVSWVAHALTTNPFALYHANIFYPHTNTLAYSEANIVAGALGIPAYSLSRGNPFTTHNSVVLMAFAFSMMSGYALTRYLTGSTAAAVGAGIAFAYCPFIFARTAHMQLLMTFGLPLAWLALHRLVDNPSIARALALSAALVVQALACAYYGIFAGLIVAFSVLYYAIVRGLWRQWRYWALVTLAAVAAIGAVTPFFLPFLAVQKDFGFSRTLEDASMFSADWQAWLASSAYAHEWVLKVIGRWNEVLFPGMLVTLLGVMGAWIGLGRKPAPEGASPEEAGATPAAAATTALSTPAGFGNNRRRETTVLYVLIGGIALWASFGPSAGLYRWFYDVIPIFTFLRAPARFGIVVALVLSVLMAIAVARFLAGRSRREQWILGGLLAALLSCELATAAPDYKEAGRVSPGYRMLARLPRGPVAEFPFFYRRSDFPQHAQYMLSSTYHWQPLINGYSDHIPEDFRRMVTTLSSFPSMDGFKILKEHRVRYVVFHPKGYDHRLLARLSDRLTAYQRYLRLLNRDDDVWLYEIAEWPASE